MNQGAARNYRETLIYLICWVAAATMIFVFLRVRRDKLYSGDLYESLLMTVSKSRPLINDPCLYSIRGDPVAADDNFAKVFLYCNSDEKSANSFHLGALKNDSYGELLTEIGRINSFRVKFIDKYRVRFGEDEKQTDSSWKCFSDHERIIDFSVRVKRKARVECFFNYSDKEIKNIYETI